MIVLAQAVDPQQVRQTVADVLSQPDYHQGGRSLVGRALDALGEWLGRLLVAFSGGGDGGSGALASVAVIVAILVAAGLLARFLGTFRRTRASADSGVTGEVGVPAQAWAARAVAHREAGRLRDALRCRYREMVAQLAAGGLLREIPGRTAGEYRTALAASLPAGADAFGALTVAFERAWYGGVVVDDAMLQHAEAAMAQVRHAARLPAVRPHGETDVATAVEAPA